MSSVRTFETKHTPGPWSLDRDGDIRSSHTAENGYASEYVATMLFNNYRDERIEERLPNARLIAAAPDLLAACEAVLSAIDIYPERQHPMTASEIVLRAAVVKAKGTTR